MGMQKPIRISYVAFMHIHKQKREYRSHYTRYMHTHVKINILAFHTVAFENIITNPHT